MEKFYSALVVNSKLFPNIKQIFKPRFNKEYFKRLLANIDSLEKHVEKRSDEETSSLGIYKKDIVELIKLKNRPDKDLEQLQELEDRVLPKVLLIPNRHSKNVPEQDTVLGQISERKTDGNLNHIKLSYINNCYQRYLVGPNSEYFFGIAAKLHHGIREYFTQNLEDREFIPVSGLCLTKSAVVEAVNSRDHKSYFTDPCRVLTTDSTRFTTTHLVEASRESLVGFLTTLGHRSSNKSLKLLTSGSGYSVDPDNQRTTQFETVHCLIHSPSIETYSMAEYHTMRDTIWNLYSELGIPARFVHCSLGSMRLNEYDAHRVDVWLPSRSEWIETARISHYSDYITIRTGMKRGHLIDSMVYHSKALISAIIENNQTSTGKFVIPTVIEDYMPYLSETERRNYFKNEVNTQPVSNSFINYQQRRYLAKKPYLFSHSRRAHKNQTFRRQREKVVLFVMVMISASLFDWNAIWIHYIPTSLQRFLYDYIFRPGRRVYRSLIYVGGAVCPPDEPYDQVDKSHYEKTLGRRRQEEYAKQLPAGRLFPLPKPGANGGEDEKVELNKTE